MPNDFLTHNDAEFVQWLKAYKNNIDVIIEQVNLPETEAMDAIEACDKMIASTKKVDELKIALKAAVAEKKILHKEGKDVIRSQVRRIKASKNYSASMGRLLGIISKSSRFDPDEFIPDIELRRVAKGVEVHYIKGKTHGMNIYRRMSGEVEFKFIGRDTHSPFLDVDLNGHAELEYMAVGVLNDEEIGIESKISTIVV